jgi:hypothetical protein
MDINNTSDNDVNATAPIVNAGNNAETEGDRSNEMNVLPNEGAQVQRNDKRNVTNPKTIAPDARQTRSGRTVRAPSHLKDYAVYEASIIDGTSHDFTDGIDPISIMMTSSQDKLYFHEFLREPDKMQFVSAMKEQINNFNVNNNWEPIRRSNILYLGIGYASQKKTG